MKKILSFICICVICTFDAGAVTRSNAAQNRGKTTLNTTNEIKSKATTSTTTKSGTTSRSTQQNRGSNQRNTATRVAVKPTRKTTVRNATPSRQNVVSRATTTQQTTPIETKTGAQYEQCKTALFTCMDQFCAMKNETFQRCSCSDRIYDFQEIYETYQQVSTNLTEFSENLDVVGMTYDQALSMKTASAGEDALTEDKSASKQLLQAIMNAIKGEDASIGGKYKDLNSINISSDMTNAFGLDNSGQIIASYNGTTLYKSVFPTCKSIVQDDCNNASLQRAINAYLMAIEQDCNTVEAALKTQQKALKTATHENSALLDLARVENRKKHNANDIATCIANVESAIQSDEVCGENYHKCLDYGQFIDVTTGAPLTGVVDFYKLGELLRFKTAENLENQKLSAISDNRNFVNFFENKTKKFAQPALDKCVENADVVWKQYLDMALLDIYYAQQAKVDKIEQSCFDLVTACYENQGTAIASAMANLTNDSSIILKPATIDLTNQLCSNYIDSCNNMFGGNVVKNYLANKKSTDSETACRAIAQQCFDKFGSVGYENFYSPQSGLFQTGAALDWFSLYDDKGNIISPCAQELASTEGCTDGELLKQVFGGFDKIPVDGKYVYAVDDDDPNTPIEDRQIRSRGVASEVYAKIINNLSIQCEDISGYFLEYKYAIQYGYDQNNFCQIDTVSPSSAFYINPAYISDKHLHYWYKFMENENMCPADYAARVDVQSWGVCSCWENGGYRSQNGRAQICRPLLPIASSNTTSIPNCTADMLNDTSSEPDGYHWCQQTITSSLSQVCPRMDVKKLDQSSYMLCANGTTIIEPVLEHVRQPKATETEISSTSHQAWIEISHTTGGWVAMD